jgi:hypothetical protein
MTLAEAKQKFQELQDSKAWNIIGIIAGIFTVIVAAHNIWGYYDEMKKLENTKTTTNKNI